MEIQTLIVVAIILAAAAYLGNRFYRTARSAREGDGCASGCGCDAPASRTAPRH